MNINVLHRRLEGPWERTYLVVLRTLWITAPPVHARRVRSQGLSYSHTGPH